MTAIMMGTLHCRVPQRCMAHLSMCSELCFNLYLHLCKMLTSAVILGGQTTA